MTVGNSVFVVRESFGTYGLIGPPPYQPWSNLKKAEEETRFTVLSRDGKYFAIGRASSVDILQTEDGRICSIVPQRMLSAQFSPQNRYLISWENPVKGVDNFKIWSLDTETDGDGCKNPQTVFSQPCTKLPEAQFSWNDQVYARLSNDGRILFYDSTDFRKEIARTLDDMKVSAFALSPGKNQSAFVCYVKGGKQQDPSYIRMYIYPDVEHKIAQRSSFQSDRVSIKWNPKGTAVLVTTMTDVDKTGGSYYGKTTLEYLDVKGDAYKVLLDGVGGGEVDLHACEWSPNSKEFCIIVGKMPNTRAALMNLKGDKILDMEIAARNDIYFNPQGNIVLICGLGNLPGNIDIWELKKYKKCIARFRAQNATQVQWLNDGVHFITATTAPRMQVDNCYKVWDFTGASVFDWNAEKHLFGITSFAAHDEERTFPEDKLDERVKTVGKMSLKGETAPVYVPVHKRGKNAVGSLMPPKSQGTPEPSKQTGDGSSSTITKPSTGAVGDTELKEKKIKKLRKSIEAIDKLRAAMEAGKPLEVNQKAKMRGLQALLDELEELHAS